MLIQDMARWAWPAGRALTRQPRTELMPVEASGVTVAMVTSSVIADTCKQGRIRIGRTDAEIKGKWKKRLLAWQQEGQKAPSTEQQGGAGRPVTLLIPFNLAGTKR